jgi:hypothetical protein
VHRVVRAVLGIQQFPSTFLQLLCNIDSGRVRYRSFLTGSFCCPDTSVRSRVIPSGTVLPIASQRLVLYLECVCTVVQPYSISST